MPELPEVETVRLQLEKYLVGHKIESVDIKYRNFEGDPKLLAGSKVKSIRRFGKVLSLDLDSGYCLVIHIKLTGQLIYRGPNFKSISKLSKKIVGGVPGVHTHVIFNLDKGGKLYYNDVRRFGWIKIIQSSKLKIDNNFLSKLGPEPLVNPDCPPEDVLTQEKFGEILSKTSRAIKVVLMDQEKIGGIGNIYANDALWLAKVDPKTPAKRLDNKAAGQLFDAIHTVLTAGLKYGGASELAFVTPDGQEGQYQNHTLAYGHEGHPCQRCHKSMIKKYFLSGRGTYWCPTCQS